MRGTKAGGGTMAAILMLAGTPAVAAEPSEVVPVSGAAGMVAVVLSNSPLVPADFKVPVLVEAPGFKLVPLGPALVKVDFDAYMSSIDHLQRTFTRSTDWPHKNISDADAMKDMETEQARFQKRESFAYAVLTPDGSRERGCVYVYPSTVKGYDAVVRLWVTKAEYDAGFDAELYQWVIQWMQTGWPFARVAYPGRSVDWDRWDALVAANAPAKAAP